MKLLSFRYGDRILFGPKVKREDAVWDMLTIAEAYGVTDFPQTITEGIAFGMDFVEQVRQLAEQAREDDDPKRFKYEFTEIEWLAPIPRTPKNVLCVGKNYADHVTEMGGDAPPEKLMIFTKSPTAIAADEQDLPIHEDVTEYLDYEGELAIVISKKGRHIRNSSPMIISSAIQLRMMSQHVTFKRHMVAYFLGKSLISHVRWGLMSLRKTKYRIHII